MASISLGLKASSRDSMGRSRSAFVTDTGSAYSGSGAVFADVSDALVGKVSVYDGGVGGIDGGKAPPDIPAFRVSATSVSERPSSMSPAESVI
jgi:hypothetical protein